MNPVCPLCQNANTQLLADQHEDAGVAYTLHACVTCGGQFWVPFKNPGADWYEHDERYANRNIDPILTANKKHKDVISNYPGKPGTLLDIGCGVGNFLAYARTKGWEGWGIDFDHDAIEAGKRTFNLSHLEVADLSGFMARHPDVRFNLVSFFDVFEHIDNHNEFLEEVKGLIAPKGAIALSLPYRHGWRWLLPADLPPRHLTRWDEGSLKAILARHGFRMTYLRRLPASLHYLVMKFRFRYGKWASLGLVRKAKEQAALATLQATGSSRASRKVRFIALLANVKDAVLFGIPALLVWLVLLPSRLRYTDLYVIAEAV